MAEAAEKRWTVEEFLDWHDGTDRRFELVDGQIVAMAPPSEAHGRSSPTSRSELQIASNRPVACVGEAGVSRPTGTIPITRPTCCDLRAAGARSPDPVDPVLIIEVLSPSTEVHDRGRKVEDYSRLPSVREILLVSSEERRVRYWRRDGPRWIVEDLIGEAELRLETVSEPIPLAAVYEGSGV